MAVNSESIKINVDTLVDQSSSNITMPKKKKLKCDCKLLSLCLITLLSNSAYALIAPFLPQELQIKGIPLYMFGYIFSIYSVAVMISSPFVGYSLNMYKRRNFLQFGMFCMAGAMLCFAMSSYIKSYYAFLIMVFVSRIL